ncbi:MAG: winged helix DNA-binding domain-containing protein [Ginsengibacter sp.]
MNLRDIANYRLMSQQIEGTKFKAAKDLVSWMGAMQAQDYSMAKWGIGMRLLTATENNIDEAIDSGEIIRTHVLRPTWHFVSAGDIYWMLELTGPAIKALAKSREKQLDLTEKIFSKSNAVIEKALRNGKHLTRDELKTVLRKNKIAVDNSRASHLFLRAELEGIICSGIHKEKKFTHALLGDRVLKTKKIHKEEALAMLAQRYFTSHAPATLQDFTWWSGLSAKNARHAFEIIKNNFISETINAQTFWFPGTLAALKAHMKSVYLLPAFDEFLVSYKDRSAAIVFEHQEKAFSNNGIFWPTILINGRVSGIWKRTIKKNTITIETDFFQPANKTTKALVEKAGRGLSHFLNKKILPL